ncbi:UNVERIFIED_CONTAM: hypothetical protein K2H54_031719 [Gekko kuhli]
MEGRDLTMTPGGTPTFLLCDWYRAEEHTEANRIFTYVPSSSSSPKQRNGPGFTGRETGGPGCSLHIRSLMLSDAGAYRVSKSVRGGLEGQRVVIGVFEKLFPPILRPAEIFVEEHANVTLNCTTSECSRVSVLWFKDWKLVPAKVVYSEQYRALTIPDASRDDEGMYTCEARNAADRAMSNPSKIAVTEKLFPPILQPAELFVEEHANITLNCTTPERSGVTVSWFKDGKAVPAKAVLSEQNRALTVPDVSRDDAGTYTCQARSPAKSAMSNPSKIAVKGLRSPLTAIVLGSLALAALGGTLLFCFFRAQSQKQMNPVYENMDPSAQVMPVNSSETNNTYEELQHSTRDVYNQLRW